VLVISQCATGVGAVVTVTATRVCACERVRLHVYGRTRATSGPSSWASRGGESW